MRLFIALPLPVQVENALKSIIQNLKKYDERIRWVNPSNIHVTLRFLGETDPKQVPELKQIITDATTTCKPFAVRITKIGAFPNIRHPRIIWAGFHDDLVSVQVNKLASIIEQSVRESGFEPEKKKFRPHLTLARIKNPASLKALPQILQNYKIEPIECKLNKICLFQSTLTPKGPIYDRIVEANLGVERLSG